MITSSTYRDRVSPQRDMLAAFSALDHRTTGDFSDAQVDDAFRRLLARLCSLMFLHGPAAPARFLAALDDPDRDAVAVTSSFLERGDFSPEAEQGPSELQQELVHFSRIVDVGTVGFDDAAAARALRRLHNSDRIPVALKVTSELVIVARSRLLQRGAGPQTPHLRHDDAGAHDLDNATTVFVGETAPHQLLAVAGPRRRERRQLGYRFRALTAYLTPTEAVAALWAHADDEVTGDWLEMALAERRPDGTVAAMVWDWSRPATGTSPARWCAAHLPRLTVGARRPVATWRGLGIIPAGEPTKVTDPITVTGVAGGTHTVTLTPAVGTGADPADLAARAGALLAEYDGPDVLSLECGHIHLDRDLDVDQDTGVRIGAAAYRLLAARQPRPPALTPMMDDDHVLIKLRPADYATFLARHLPTASSHLIVESSPIVRSIVAALYARLAALGQEPRLRERGGNLFLQMDQGWYCELFEDVAGPMATGCIFFETALLIYRTAPERFDGYFMSRYGLDEPLHETACAILDQDGDHDTRSARLLRYYRRFGDVTDPRRPDAGVVALVEDVLAGVGECASHLNVLEDYYEVQQRKVRALLKVLGLPFQLVTLHFNAATARVVLDA